MLSARNISRDPTREELFRGPWSRNTSRDPTPLTGALPDIADDITADDIIDLLPIVADRGWRILGNGYIRDMDDRCPVCALAHEMTDGKVDYELAAHVAAKEAWGVKERFIVIRLMRAADKEADYNMRRRMLKMLGLEGER